jgi:hypothetical protein
VTPALMGTWLVKLARCQPLEISPEKVALANNVPVEVHRWAV